MCPIVPLNGVDCSIIINGKLAASYYALLWSVVCSACLSHHEYRKIYIVFSSNKKGLFIWISRCENVQRDPPDSPTWLVFPNTCFYPGGGGLKSLFLQFLTFLAYRAQDSSHSGAVSRVQLDRVDSSAPSHTVSSTQKSVSWS